MGRAEPTGPPLTVIRLAIVACVPLVILFAVSFARIVVADYSIHQQKLELESEISQLKKVNTQLNQRIDYLNTDTGVELLAREELGWVRPDDTLVVVLDESASAMGGSVGVTPTLTPSPRR
jgi:cell division protein FtsB